jgi:hypothetical protein
MATEPKVSTAVVTMRRVLPVAVLFALITSAAALGASLQLRHRNDRESNIASSASHDFKFIASGGGNDVEARGAVSPARGLGQVRYEFFPQDPVFKGLTPPSVVVVADGIGYFSIDGTHVARETGRTWVYRSYSVDDLVEAPISGVADPFGLYDALRGSARLEPRGTESVRGTVTTRYTGVLADTSPRLEDAERHSNDGESLKVELWIDAAHITRRLRVTNDLGDRPFVVEYFAFGEEASVDIPPEDAILSNHEYVRAVERAAQERSQ